MPAACTTCATSTTAATPSPAAGCSCWTTRSATSPRLVNLLENSVVENGRLQGPEARRRLVPLAGSLLRRPDDPLRLQRGRGLGEDQGKEAYQWAPGVQLPHLQGQRRRHGPGPADRRRLATISIPASCPAGGSRSSPSGAAATCAAAGTARSTRCSRWRPTAATSSA